MSVSSTTSKIVYTGSGTTGPFDFDFVIYLSSDLVVEKFTIATGATTTLTETTDYSVTIAPDGTGYVTAVAAVTSAYKLIIRRVLPLTQEIDYVEGDKFPAETHEEGLDRSRMVDQQLQEQIDRAVLQNPTVSTQITLPGAVTGNALVWDADGNLVNSDEALVGPQGEKGDKGDTGDAGVVQSIVAGTNVTVDDTDSANPVVSARTPKATGADIDTGTEDAEFVTPKALADQTILPKYADTRFFVGTFTRDMTAANGDVAITGVGFAPKVIHFFGAVDGKAIAVFGGLSDGTKQYCSFDQNGVSAGTYGVVLEKCIRLQEATGKTQEAIVKTFDADGFTLTWTKNGTTAAGTAYINYIAYR